MFAIIDSRSSGAAICKLKEYVEDVFEFRTDKITGNSISGHPDIFIYQDKNHLVVAPNAPDELFDFMSYHNIACVAGKREVGNDLYNTVQYNCLSTPDFLFHKPGYTDPTILELNQDKEFIPLPQAYTRCSLAHLCGNNFLTSDRGIEKALLEHGLSCTYFNPGQISITDHNNGFIGGTIGIWGKRIFFNGNPELHADGEQLRRLLQNQGYEIISLSGEYLYDGGCIFFVE